MNNKGINLILAGLLLIVAAFLLTAYNVHESNRAGEEAVQALKELEPQIQAALDSSGRERAEEFPELFLKPDREMPEIDIKGYKYIGYIRIPALDLELPVLSRWDYTNLNISPCRYVGTAYKDNFVICAHNYDKHFGKIKNLSIGDEISFTDADGNVFKYKVGEILTLQPEAVEEMTVSEWDLSLFTCTLGGATRVTVRCEKIEE